MMALFAYSSSSATQDGWKWMFVFFIVAGFLAELWKRLNEGNN